MERAETTQWLKEQWQKGPTMIYKTQTTQWPKEQWQKGPTMIYKTLHTKLKIK